MNFLKFIIQLIMFTGIVRRQIQFLLTGVILVSLLLVFLPELHAHAASFTVDILTDSTDANPGNGICADSAGKCSIRAGIEETNALAGADTLNIPAGDYLMDPQSANNILEIQDYLELIGAGSAATTITIIGQNTLFTFINANLPPNSQVSFQGFELVTDNNNFCEGGIISVQENLNIAINDVAVSGCNSGLYLLGANAQISNSSFSNNSIFGIALTNTNATIENVNLSENNIGGINIVNTISPKIVTMNNTKIFNNGNEGSSKGGGIYFQEDCFVPSEFSLFMTNSEIYQNTAMFGGGIYNECGHLELNTTSVTDNEAIIGGGLYLNYDSPSSNPASETTFTSIKNSTISGNTLTQNGFGGGIYLNTDRPNTATIPYTFDMLNTTVANNSSGIVFGHNGYQNIPINVRMRNNLFVNAGQNCEYRNQEYLSQLDITIINGSTYTGNNNRSSDASCANDTSFTFDNSLATNLGLLQYNGGDTKTHALLTGSGAINSGSNTDCPAQDQANQPRPSGATCDVGAFEFQEVTTETYTFSGTLYIDRNKNGIQDSDDTIVPNTLIEILDNSGNVVLTLTSNSNGEFNGVLPIGNYSYRVGLSNSLAYGAINTIFSINQGVNTLSIPLINGDQLPSVTPLKNLIRTGGF